MSKLLYSATMSLDGFIAGPGGDMQWTNGLTFEPSPTADALVDQVGCLLIGRRTFFGDDPNRDTEAEGAFGGQYDGPAVLLTRHPPAEPVAGVEVETDLHAAVRRAKELAGDRYVNVLGAGAARSCVEAGLLDEVLVFVAPVLLGDGVRLFEHPGGHTVLLDRLPGTAEHWYTVRRGEVPPIGRPSEEESEAVARMWHDAWHDGHDGHVPEALLPHRDPAYFARQARALADSTLVAVEAREVLGMVIVHDDEVVQLAVAASARRRGVGGALLAAAEARIAEQHATAWLAVVPGNTRARRFYEGLGWRDEGPMTYQAPASPEPVPVLVHRYTKPVAASGGAP
jgi:dihydrofolate reductase/ribosomal protein S18 acetylase RimI-like enzyme